MTGLFTFSFHRLFIGHYSGLAFGFKAGKEMQGSIYIDVYKQLMETLLYSKLCFFFFFFKLCFLMLNIKTFNVH